MRQRAVNRCIALGVLESIQHTTPGHIHRKPNPLPAVIGWLLVVALAIAVLAVASKGA